MNVDAMYQVVYITHHVTVEELTGPSRKQALVRLRWACALALREEGMSYPMIAQMLGRHDHTTAMLAVRRAQEWARRDATFLMFVGTLRQVLGEHAWFTRIEQVCLAWGQVEDWMKSVWPDLEEPITITTTVLQTIHNRVQREAERYTTANATG